MVGLPGGPLWSFRTIAAGSRHTCGITQDGKGYCWGNNFSGALGDTTTTSRYVPTAVQNYDTFVKLSLGADHSCATKSNGSLWCWGANSAGQLGDGTIDPRTSPVSVWNSAGAFTVVSTGGAHSCGLNTSGAAYCWGDASMGQIGDGLVKSPVSGSMGQGGQLQMVPSRVTGGIAFANVAAGTNHSCGVTTDGAAWCWGEKNSLGATVSNTWSMPGSISNVPVKVTGTVRFKPESLAAGGSTCAISTSDTPYCWGAINMWDRSYTMPYTEPVAVNVSGRHLSGAVVDHVARALADTAWSPERLQLEISEAALGADPRHATRVLEIGRAHV